MCCNKRVKYIPCNETILNRGKHFYQEKSVGIRIAVLCSAPRASYFNGFFKQTLLLICSALS